MLPSDDPDVSEDPVIQARETGLSDMTCSHRAPWLMSGYRCWIVLVTVASCVTYFWKGLQTWILIDLIGIFYLRKDRRQA